MAIKNVYFYEVQLQEFNGGREVRHQEIKTIFKDIIEKHAVVDKNLKTLDLTLDDNPMHIMMDVLKYEDDFLFYRLSKQKPNNTMLKRNYKTLKQDGVIPESDAGENGIEMFTYCLLNYEKGILSIVSSNSAPGAKVVDNALYKFNQEYHMEFISVPNPDAIRSIYLGEEPEISKVEIEIPVPQADVMQQIFGWEEDEVTETVMRNAMSAFVTIKAPQRKALTDNEEDVKGLIDKIKALLEIYYKGAKVKAKAKSIKSKEYDLFAKNFSYPVDIPMYRIEDNDKIDYTLEELAILYRKSMLYAFEKNKKLICTITGR